MIHRAEKNWDTTILNELWVGGRFKISNQSGGYHGLLKQWWEQDINHFNSCMLVSENVVVKQEFKSIYSHIDFLTLDYYDNMGEDVDVKLNLCEPWSENEIVKVDGIICQATFEHLYDPVTAIKNLANSLNTNGKLYIHTHVPGMPYHAYPKDYLRYHADWFFEMEKVIPDFELKNLIEVGVHIFASYTKIGV